MDSSDLAETSYLDERSYFRGLVCRVVIPSYPDRTPYLIRWKVSLPFGFAIYLHKILKSDVDRDMHDHPWNFLSILVWGSYVEETPNNNRRLKQWFNFHWATDSHRVELFKRDGVEIPVYTIILRGKRVREWGYPTENGWIPWREYNQKKFGEEVI